MRLDSKISLFLDRILFGLSHSCSGFSLLEQDLRKFTLEVATGEPDADSSVLAAQAELLQVLLLRIKERKPANDADAFVRRKHVKQLLHQVAISGSAGVLPSALADGLGVPRSAITNLLKSARSLGLVERSVNDDDARFKPARLTRAGRAALRNLIPNWSRVSPKVEPALRVNSNVATSKRFMGIAVSVFGEQSGGYGRVSGPLNLDSAIESMARENLVLTQKKRVGGYAYAE